MKMKRINLALASLVVLIMISCGGNKHSNGLTEGASGDMEAFFLLRVFQNLLTENVEKAHTLCSK